jgi:hypothetical protein
MKRHAGETGYRQNLKSAYAEAVQRPPNAKKEHIFWMSN